MTKNTLSEIELLHASLQGQTPAFEVIVKKYQSLICTITYSATGSVEKSEELAQQAFVKCWKNLSQLQDLTKFRS
ncbi:MAG: RNA polymerase sigma factor, partial [Planctomycetota bacterium]